MKIAGTILFYLLLITGIYFGFKYITLPKMNGGFALLAGLSSAFVWVEVLHWGFKKPFNCIKCMSAWLTLIIAWAFHVDFFYFYLPIGLFAGAIFDRLKIKFL
jgi:hypothetical protein